MTKLNEIVQLGMQRVCPYAQSSNRNETRIRLAPECLLS